MAEKKEEAASKSQAEAAEGQADAEKAEKEDTRTEDEKKEAEIKFNPDDIKKGVQLIKDQGYVTKKDFKRMKDDYWAAAFYKKVDAAFQDDADDDPYLYVERFDFKGGNIDSIIFDMDKVKTRADALKILADVTKQTVVKPD
ncbi:hypothetical protein WR164_13560 [Philodulcilactobacillus myokoensis]|uniref:Uncharacterized protein n=1 Tax=Philodulcilactobacillus myokoensis TaxID=2929573 RepID=A0A9W6ETG8_9LACO|nr:hypothetical protein [Philodulcilactobacillus myokoensis]GLB47377.1 hypothetical protein WR164_13560 [Philodulcilactobacillus myokoensis]